MGLKCSLLGHAFEPADVEREREEQGSEVITTVRELERCIRCGEERVVSESTEVAAVVDADDVEMEESGGFGGVVDRSGAAEDDPDEGEATTAETEAEEFLDGPSDSLDADLEERDPAEEDAEILTDDDSDRGPGEWPEESYEEAGDPGEEPLAESPEFDAPDPEPEPEPEDPDESLSGITVPDGDIACPECPFQVEAQSGYREGDPCPECGAWLTAERNP